jgi:hypothetical protein
MPSRLTGLKLAGSSGGYNSTPASAGVINALVHYTCRLYVCVYFHFLRRSQRTQSFRRTCRRPPRQEASRRMNGKRLSA